MKKTFLQIFTASYLLLFTLTAGVAQAQEKAQQPLAVTAVVPVSTNLGINTTTPHASAVLDVTSTTQGMLVPRMTKAQRDAISAPATGLMIFQTDNTSGFYFYNGNEWTTVGANSTSGGSLQLYASKANATQTLASAQGTNTGDLVSFDNVVTSPSLGTWNTSTNTYTVGTGGAGTYMIQVHALVFDNATPSNTVGPWFMVEVNNSDFGSPNNFYGPYPVFSSSNFPSGLKGRGQLTAVLRLNAGDVFKIKGLTANSSQTTTLKNDGSVNLTVVKLN